MFPVSLTEGGVFFSKPVGTQTLPQLSREKFSVKKWGLGGIDSGVTRNDSELAKIGLLKLFNIMAKKQKKIEVDNLEVRLENLKSYIRKVLKKAGKYRSEMTQQVELTATTLLIFRKIRSEILENDSPPIIEEKSREGDLRKKENPIYTMYRDFANLLRRDLRALKMNQELARNNKEDEEPEDEKGTLVTLMKDLNKEDEEE